MDRSTEVYLREEKKSISVNITSEEKPELSSEVLQKWQRVIDIIAKIFKVPAGLIMKITQENMEVFLTSRTKNNPYKPNGYDSLGHGLYCETVIGRNSELEIANSLSNPSWRDNPDVKLNMISYLGYPLAWPDGEVFGTICVLDSKERSHNDEYRELLNEFKLLIEADLKKELMEKDLQEAESISSLRLREIHHRIKNQFNIISSIIQLKANDSDKTGSKIINDINSKIKSISLLHDKIYKSDNFDVSINDYIKSVVGASLSIYNSDVNVIIEADTEIEYNSKNMFEFGLVFSELVTNSVKNGLPIENGEIYINISSLKETKKGDYFIKYRDNGPGFPESILQGYGKQGIGSLLIESFLSKFNGRIRRYNDNGAVIEFQLSRIYYK